MGLFKVSFITLIVSATACLPPVDFESSPGNHSQNLESRYFRVDKPRLPWPKDKDSDYHTIPYCYADWYTYDQLHMEVHTALDLWSQELHPSSGPQIRHALKIKDPASEESEDQPYCYIADKYGKSTGEWNDLYDPGTLVIRESPGADEKHFSSWATLGYGEGTEKGRHKMTLNFQHTTNAQVTSWVTAHEFGHVFGLRHEHQRPDRDNYVHFECKNIRGYDQALKDIEGTEITIEQLCTDEKTARKYLWRAVEFLKKPFRPKDDGTGDEDDGEYDIYSIMGYPSWTFGNYEDPKGMLDIMAGPLAEWKVPNQDPHPTERTTDNCKINEQYKYPSRGDKKGIQRLYPLKGS